MIFAEAIHRHYSAYMRKLFSSHPGLINISLEKGKIFCLHWSSYAYCSYQDSPYACIFVYFLASSLSLDFFLGGVNSYFLNEKHINPFFATFRACFSSFPASGIQVMEKFLYKG